MNVVVNYHSEKHRGAAQELADACNANGRTVAVVVQADISQEEGAQKLLDAALDAFGTVDVWVNNAGIESRYPTHELPLEEWEKALAVNLTGVFLGSKAALAQFVETGTKGVIVNLSSVHEKVPWPTFAHYTASKGGVKLFSETIALEYAHLGIRVNCIAPGAIETPINAGEVRRPEGSRPNGERAPMGTIGTVEQIAAAAAWLGFRPVGVRDGTEPVRGRRHVR